MRKATLCRSSVLIVVLVSGCGGGTSEPTADGSTTAQPTSAANAPVPAPLSRSAAPRALAHRALLSVNDLPGSGWQREDDSDPESSSDQRASQMECIGQLRALRTSDVLAAATDGWSLSADQDTKRVSTQVYVYNGSASAVAAMGEYRSLATRCAAWQSGGVDEYAFNEQQIVFSADLGDEAVARQKTTNAIDFPEIPAFSTYTVATRVADTITVTSLTPGAALANGPGRAPAVELARKSVAKIS